LGIPREEALKMTALEIRELLLAYRFVVEAERKRLEKKHQREQILTSPTTLLTQT
jgi:hypothetical protein